MTAFLQDDYFGVNADTLTAHTGAVGATWTLPGLELVVSAEIGTGWQTGNFRLRHNGAVAGTGHYLSSGSPASADHWARATILVLSVPSASGGGIGITLRTDATCANFYLVQYNYTATAWQLFKKVAGVFTQLGSDVAQTLTVGPAYELYFSIVGTQIDFTVDGVSKFSTTDSAVSATGKIGLRVSAPSSGGGASVGIQIDQLVGDVGTDTKLRSIGDSITVGVGSTSSKTKRWAYVLGLANTWNDYTRSVSSTQIIDHCSDDRSPVNNQVYLPIAPATTDRVCWLTGYNDVRYNGANANALTTHLLALRAALTWLSRAAADVKQSNDGIWTKTGAWTTSVVNGMTSAYTSTIGDKISGSITGTYITVCYLSRFGLADASAACTVKVDGSTVDTIDMTFGTASGFTNGGSGAARYVPMAFRYGPFSAGAHTVEVIHAGTAGKIMQFLFATGNGGTPAAKLYVTGPYKNNNWNFSAPYNIGTDAAADSYGSNVTTVVAELVADGYTASQAYVNNYFVKITDENADNIHPNDTGHQHISDAFAAAIAGGGLLPHRTPPMRSMLGGNFQG